MYEMTREEQELWNKKFKKNDQFAEFFRGTRLINGKTKLIAKFSYVWWDFVNGTGRDILCTK